MNNPSFKLIDIIYCYKFNLINSALIQVNERPVFFCTCPGDGEADAREHVVGGKPFDVVRVMWSESTGVPMTTPIGSLSRALALALEWSAHPAASSSGCGSSMLGIHASYSSAAI